MTFRQIIAAAVLAAAVVPGQAQAARTTEHETAGGIGVTLSYERSEQYPVASDVRLQITRAGAVAYDGTLPAACEDCDNQPVGAYSGTENDSIDLIDLDGNGEPEVTIQMFSGGAHCCSTSQTFFWNGSGYAHTGMYWGNSGYELRDFDGDGRAEFRTADERFVYAFTAYALSLRPVQLFRFADGRFHDVTRSYPRLIAQDAKETWKIYRRIRKDRLDVRGALAAYLGDKYLLGQGRSGLKAVRAAQRRGEVSAGYVRKLLRLLKNWDYR